MSERGSFVTEFIYCKECFETLKNELLQHKDKYLHVVQVDEFPILAGKVGAMSMGQEVVTMIQNTDEIKLCHPVRVSILCDVKDHDEVIILGDKQ